MTDPRFRSVALDVDSTLCAIEGIDWLASRRDKSVSDRVALATDQAMRGEVPLEDLYGKRLELVSPTRDEMAALTAAYKAAVAPDAEAEIKRWRESGVHVVLLSGGLRAAIAPFARDLGFDSSHVNALDVEFDGEGIFLSFDKSSPLYTALGKRSLLAKLDLPRPLLAVGDGMTDLAMKEVADAFAAFTGFVRRESVVSKADYVVSSFPEISRIVFGES